MPFFRHCSSGDIKPPKFVSNWLIWVLVGVGSGSKLGQLVYVIFGVLLVRVTSAIWLVKDDLAVSSCYLTISECGRWF